MSRFLFMSPPLAGHINAPLAVAHALTARGHDVAWVGSEAYLRPLVGPHTTVYATGTRLYRPQADRGLPAIRTLWERFVLPFARFTLPTVERAVDEFDPDVVAVDQHAVAGAVVATRRELAWASLAPQAMELTRPLRSLFAVETWIRGRLDAAWALGGEPGPAPIDLRFSPHLVIGFTSPVLTGPAELPPNCALVGPAVHRRLDTPDFDWARLDSTRRILLVSMGTMADDVASDFFARISRAVRGLDAQVVFNCPTRTLPDPPTGAIVAERIPMLDLLPRINGMVSHGGLNSVVESLAHAVPLVLAPIRNDQPVVANQVVAAGAGLRVRFARATPETLREAVTTMMDDPGLRAGAIRVRDSFPAEGGAAAAARHLVELANSPR